MFRLLSPPEGGLPPARTRTFAIVTTFLLIAMLILAGSAAASIVQLPPGAQVNDDPAVGIDRNQDAGVSDVVGGSLTGAVNVPWASFEQKSGSAQEIFVRSFANGHWTSRGISLNIDPAKEAEAPSIDFAGANRTVPWVSWYEPNDKLPGGETNIFASRFDAPNNTWIPEGQDRSAGFKIPSLNIHTDREAENPALVGGAAAGGPGTAPVPWVAWQEKDGRNTNDLSKNQIFVSKGIKQTDCTGLHPGNGGPSVSNFCWQQVGLKRLDPTNATAITSSATGDPSLNVDPTRDGIEPDFAFTGKNATTGQLDTVPWVVWYETGNTGTSGANKLADNEQVFASKAVADPNADGGFHWQAVGNGTAGQTNVLDTSGANHHFGNCAETREAENACSLNLDPTKDAENPRVATGTLTPGGTTVPWVTWQEKMANGKDGIFVSRLVNGDHFELFNNGQPVSDPNFDSTRPDITFEGNVPYITWQETHGTINRAFSGHFEGTTFITDTPGGLPGAVDPEARVPVSSGCTANPFTLDGLACPGGAAGTPFFLRTTDDAPKALLAHTYAADSASTGAATQIGQNTATVSGSTQPGGGSVNVHFEFGTTTAYGNVTPNQRLDAAVAGRSFSAALSGLPAGTTIHYRVVVSTDFGTLTGDDATFTTAPAPIVIEPNPGTGQPKIKKIVVLPSIGGGKLHLGRHRTIKVTLACPKGSTRCVGTLKLVVKGHTLGSAHYSIAPGHKQTLTIRVSSRSALTLRKARKVVLTLGTHHKTLKIS